MKEAQLFCRKSEGNQGIAYVGGRTGTWDKIVITIIIMQLSFIECLHVRNQAECFTGIISVS